MTQFPLRQLLEWYQANKREMPWRKTEDPYKIWISEIMLQQTRVDTVIPYYNRFLEAFPDVQSLAGADQQQVLKQWEGLGYYSRARNMHVAAKTVTEKYDGNMPGSYDELIKLKGIGPYTAAAISSIAFNEQKAVVDGNVLRVFCRYFGIDDDIRSQNTKNQVRDLAEEIIPENEPGDFNQAVMELGATVCTPHNPDCNSCPISVHCVAFNTAQTESLPYKSASKKVPHHQIAVGIIVNGENKLLIAKRPEDAMLGGLWEFAGGKQEKGESLKDTVQRELKEELGVDVNVFDKFMQLNHAYSHFKITLHAFWCKIENGKPIPKTSTSLRWVDLDEIEEYPFPKANKTLIEKMAGLKDNLQSFISE